MSQIVLNEKSLGNLVTLVEVQAAISYLQGRGYAVTYGAYNPQAAQSIKPAHWRAAIKAAHQAAAEQPVQRDFADLTLAQQAATLAEINTYLAEVVCQKLADAMPAPTQDDNFLAEALQQAEAVLNGE